MIPPSTFVGESNEAYEQCYGSNIVHHQSGSRRQLYDEMLFGNAKCRDMFVIRRLAQTNAKYASNARVENIQMNLFARNV